MNYLQNIDEAPLNNLNLKWKSLDISKRLFEVIKKEFKFDRMTPVQAAAIPLMLKNKDVIVEAKTGSGKTLAFLIPIIDSLIKIDQTNRIDPHDILGVILSPTRELATQIHQELRKLLRSPLLEEDRKLGSLLIVGGTSVSKDIEKYKRFGTNIIVATPGRMSKLMEMSDNPLSSSIRKKLQFLIFDEADHLLSFGFERDISSILNYLPKQRRTSLFSATQTSQVDELIKSGLRNAIRVNVNKIGLDKGPNIYTENDNRLPMPENLSNFYHICDSYGEKLGILLEMIKSDEYMKMLVFFSTCYQVDFFSHALERHLKDKKVTLLKLHRRLKNKRKAIYSKFKTSKRCVLMVTDILSRGIDVPDISCVIHVDLPASPECYVHRSGRSGHQIELSGISLLLLEEFEKDYIEMCRRRQIELSPYDMSNISESIPAATRSLNEQLTKLASKGSTDETLSIQAFVSYIRYYSSKLCLRQMLFPKLSICKLAICFGLPRIPKMPEFRSRYKSLVSEFETLSEGSTKLETVS